MLQHDLTEAQVKELEEKYFIHFLKNENPELFGKISNCPDNAKDLMSLAKEAYWFTAKHEAVLLPLGSPAFNYIFNNFLSQSNKPKLFAHSERVSVEQKQADGSVIKKSVFVHKHFINIENAF